LSIDGGDRSASHPRTLSAGTGTRVVTEKGAGWAPEPVWTFWISFCHRVSTQLQSIIIIIIMPEDCQYDRNMWHVLRGLVKFVVVDGIAFVDVIIPTELFPPLPENRMVGKV
jgi:hypothetical protein